MSDEPSNLRFLHLSDIHFKSKDSEVGRKNAFLRSLVVSAAERDSEEFGPINGVLVGGDVAFSGTVEEFEMAATWLADVCEAVKCDESNVWVVPGNHDVNRAAINKSGVIKNAQAGILAGDQNSTAPGERLMDALLGDTDGHVLLKPLEEYNTFAARYGCEISPQRLHWEDRFPLNDGSELVIRGLCTATLSTQADSKATRKLVLPESECLIPETSGCAHLFLCHHPPDWLCATDVIERAMSKEGKVQLFGHKHSFGVKKVGECVLVAAGAVHPDPGAANWDPRFNVLTLSVEGSDDDRALVVQVISWQWHENSQSFQRDLNTEQAFGSEYRVKLPRWIKPIATTRRSETPETVLGADQDTSTSATIITKAVGVEGNMHASRRLVYRFMSLNYLKRIEIVRELKLIEDVDEGKPARELYKLYFERAQQSGVLGVLWDAVEKAHPEPRFENPFIPKVRD